MATKKKQAAPAEAVQDQKMGIPPEKTLDLDGDMNMICTDCPAAWFGEWHGNCYACVSNAIKPVALP